MRRTIFRFCALFCSLAFISFEGKAFGKEALDHQDSLHLRRAIETCQRVQGKSGFHQFEGGVSCVVGKLYTSMPDGFLDKTDVLVLNLVGGNISLSLDFADALMNFEGTTVVNQTCASACAMILLPVVKSLWVEPNASVVVHGYIFEDEQHYVEYHAKRHGKVQSKTPDEDDDSNSAYAQGYSIFEGEMRRFEQLLHESGVSSAYFDTLGKRPDCAHDAISGIDTWTFVNKDFYAEFLNVDHWEWLTPVDKDHIYFTKGSKFFDRACWSYDD